MTRPAAIISALLLANAATLMAEDSGFFFLRMPVKAMPSSLGEATAAMGGQASNLPYNPGSLAECRNRAVSAGYVNYLADIQVGNITYVHPLKENSSAAVSLSYLNSGEIKQTTLADPTGSGLGTFNYSSIIMQASYARKLFGALDAGASLKGIYDRTLDYSAAGGAVDLGMIYRMDPAWVAKKVFGAKGDRNFGTSLRLGLAINNIGMATKAFVETKDKMPLTVRGGLEYRPMADKLVVLLAGNKPADSPFKTNFGLEFNFVSHLSVRLGYNGNLADIQNGSDLDDFAGLGAGFGIKYRKYGIDYAYTPYPGLGHPMRLDINIDI